MKSYDSFLALAKTRFVPVDRETGDRIEACAEKNPCLSCRQAEYNKLCIHTHDCAALQYHTLARMPTAVLDFFSED